ncbi:MAG: nucleotidyltransferase family protein [Candidatus Aminicenantes bacterium]|nr:MAG: nucleotidyltransferase family protein [Candidatus Aminicenantes bacterium]
MKPGNRIDNVKDKILPVLAKYQVKKASFFGSIVRGELDKESDIDILVELSDDLSLLDFIGLKNELEDTVGRKVDLVEYGTIKRALKKRILSEQVPIL